MTFSTCSLKTIFIICVLTLFVLLLTGLFLPLIISSKMQLWVIVTILITIFGVFSFLVIQIISFSRTVNKVLAYLKKDNSNNDDSEDLYNYSVNSAEKQK